MAGLYDNMRKKKSALEEAAEMADAPIGKASAVKAAKAAKPSRAAQDARDISLKGYRKVR